MLRVWKGRHNDPIETVLQANRPAPRAEYAVSMLARLESRRRSVRTASLHRRVAAAILVTAVAAGAAFAAGGASALSGGVTDLVNVASHGLNGNDNGNGNNQGQGHQSTVTTTQTTTTAAATTTTIATTTTTSAQPNVAPTNESGNSTNDNVGGNLGLSPGDHQYAVTICHHTGSDTNPWVELTLSPQGAANHLAHHPDDFVVTPSTPCPPS
jgi:hypothetical protein